MKRRFEAQQEIAVLEDKDTLSLSEISAQLQKLAPMAAALTSAVIAHFDMAKFVVTAVQAAMIGGLQGRGIPIPPGAAGDNIRFIHGESGGYRADQQTARRPLTVTVWHDGLNAGTASSSIGPTRSDHACSLCVAPSYSA